MVSIKRILVALLAVICIPLVVPVLYFLLCGVSFLQGTSLAPENPRVKTEYVFDFGNGQVVRIRDDHSMIVRSWGGSPDSTSTKDGVRTICFSDGAILKTAIDSIEPQRDYVKVKGYMGIWTDDTDFVVDENGEIDSTEWAN